MAFKEDIELFETFKKALYNFSIIQKSQVLSVVVAIQLEINNSL